MANKTDNKPTTPNVAEMDMDALREHMQLIQAQIAEREAAELEAKRQATFPVIEGMLPKVAEHVTAITEAIEAKDATKVAAEVAGLLGYVGEIRTVSADLGVTPVRPTRAAGNGEPRQGTYADQAMTWLASNPNSTAAEVHKGIEAAPGGAVHAALTRLVANGKLVLSGESPQRFSLPTPTPAPTTEASTEG